MAAIEWCAPVVPERPRGIEESDRVGLLRLPVVVLRVVFSPVVGAIVEHSFMELAWFTKAHRKPVFLAARWMTSARQGAEPVTGDSGTMHSPGKQTHLLPPSC